MKIRTFDRKLKEEKEYWLSKLSGKVEPANLRLDFERPITFQARTDTVKVLLPGGLQAKLIKLTADSPLLLYAALLAALKICLHKYTGNSSIIVGSPALSKGDSDRPANALALLDEIEGSLSFRSLLINVRETLLQAYARQGYGYDHLIKDLEIEVEPSNRCALFDFALMLRDFHGELPQVKNDVSMVFTRSAQGLTGEIEYSSRLFNRERIERFRDHFLNILSRGLGNIDLPIYALETLTEVERRRLLIEWNATARDFPTGKLIHHLLEVQAERTPEATAAAFEAKSISYGELNRRANQVAHFLQGLGVAAEVKVGIFMDRSLDMLIGLLGVMKAGGAFVPLDPSHPKHRLGFMLEDAAVSVLLTERRLVNSLPEYRGKSLCLDSDANAIDQQSVDNPISAIEPENLAYVIYTSGSTGRPKGASISHRALLNFSLAVTEQFSLTSADRFLQFASISFDVAIEEIVPSLLCGAAVIMRDQRQLASPIELTKVIEQERVTVMELPTAYWQEWVNEMSQSGKPTPVSLRLVIVGGEKSSAGAVTKWREFNKQLKHVYGVTEVAITSTVYTDSANGRQSELPIGKPIANTRIYALDAQMNPVGIGIAGEMYIGGEGLGRGYVSDAAVTAEKFVPNPFGDEPGMRLYKTGDLMTYLPGGDIEFIGRSDDQIKLRGFRVELGEIESVLKQYPGVENAVVTVKEGAVPNLQSGADEIDSLQANASGGKRLIAYVVTSQKQSPAIEDLRGYLHRRLPDYMVPSIFVMLDKLPLTRNGKVDRGALPTPVGTRPELHGAFVAPRDAVEQRLADIYADVLRLGQVGVHDNFFELGGHSLLATRVISRVRAAFEVELGLRALFESPTVGGLAQQVTLALKQARGLTAPALRRADRSQSLPLSFAQQRLWFINQLEPESALYNVPAALRLQGELDVAALERSLQEIVRRHEVLRTSFRLERGEPVQVISADWRIALPVNDLSLLAADERMEVAERLANEEAERPFDLSSGPPLRCELLRLAKRDHVLIVNMHHIVSDEWSEGILLRELTALYEAYSQGAESPLEELEAQYADFAIWQREYLSGDELDQQLAYWKRQLAGMRALDLPTDHPRPAVASHRGGFLPLSLSVDVTSKLVELSREEGVTLFMLLLAAFKALLHKYTGLDDIVVGTGVANRNRSETENLIGYFVNHLVLRTSLRGAQTFRELLGRVREVTLGAYAHQDLPFEKVVEAIRPERSLNHTPLFQVVVGMDIAAVEPLKLPGLEVEVVNVADGMSKFDLVLMMTDTPEGFLCMFNYDMDLFDTSVIEMSRHFKALLNHIVTTPDATLKDLKEMIDEADNEQWSLKEKELAEAELLTFKTGRRRAIIQSA